MYATADADDDMSVSFTRAVGEGSVLISKVKKKYGHVVCMS